MSYNPAWPPHPGYKAGNYYTDPYRRNGTITGVTDRIYYVPFTVNERIRVDAVNVIPISILGSNFVLGIYASASGVPIKKIWGMSAGNPLQTDTSVEWDFPTQNEPTLYLYPDVYFLAMSCDNVGGSETFTAITETTMSPLGHAVGTNSTLTLAYYHAAATTLTLPDTPAALTALTSATTVPSIAIKAGA